MIKILTVFALMLLLATPVTAANVTTVEIHGVVFDSNSRMIQQENVLYNTSRTDQNYILYTETGKKVDNGR